MTLQEFISNSCRDKNNIPYGLGMYYDQHMLMYFLLKDMIESDTINLSIDPKKAKRGSCVFNAKSAIDIDYSDYQGLMKLYSRLYEVTNKPSKTGDTSFTVKDM